MRMGTIREKHRDQLDGGWVIFISDCMRCIKRRALLVLIIAWSFSNRTRARIFLIHSCIKEQSFVLSEGGFFSSFCTSRIWSACSCMP